MKATGTIALALLIVATSYYSISDLLWTVRAGVPPLSANSEFLAYTWIYGVRWGAGEHIIFPHSQLIFPIFAIINRIFDMTSGNADQIIAGWRRISLVWPVFLNTVSLVLLFSTINRKAPLTDALVSAILFTISVPLFLTDHALNSLSYHSLSIPLALAALPLWRFYAPSRTTPPRSFYVMIGLYSALCALGKPTFLAFAAPFYVMEVFRAFQNRNIIGLFVTGGSATIFYLAWILAFSRSIAGVAEHFTTMLHFMRSQANWYDIEKCATPLHWYAGYVLGKMGPVPTILILFTFLVLFFRNNRAMIALGALTAIFCALFCLYSRSQLHAHPEFIALLLTTAIASFRCSGIIEGWQPHRIRLAAQIGPVILGTGAITALIWTITAPPQMLLRGFAEFMGQFDAVAIPAVFGQPRDTRTIALQSYPLVFWGTVDAWCRGSVDVFGTTRSPLLDNAFGNITCMVDRENPLANSLTYNRAIFPKERKVSLADTMATMSKAFPTVAARFSDCRIINAEIPTYELVECRLQAT